MYYCIRSVRTCHFKHTCVHELGVFIIHNVVQYTQCDSIQLYCTWRWSTWEGAQLMHFNMTPVPTLIRSWRLYNYSFTVGYNIYANNMLVGAYIES